MKKLVLTAAAVSVAIITSAHSPVAYAKGDGKMLTKEEKFDKIDTNNDGVISRAEFGAHYDAMKAKRYDKRHHGMAPSAGGDTTDPANTSEHDNIKDTKPQ